MQNLPWSLLKPDEAMITDVKWEHTQPIYYTIQNEVTELWIKYKTSPNCDCLVLRCHFKHNHSLSYGVFFLVWSDQQSLVPAVKMGCLSPVIGSAKFTIMQVSCWFTLNVPEDTGKYYGCWLAGWLLASLDYQQPWHWLCRTTRTPAFWGYPPPPHDYPYYWPVHFESQVHTIDQFISDPKSKQDERRKNLKNLRKIEILESCYKLSMRHAR